MRWTVKMNLSLCMAGISIVFTVLVSAAAMCQESSFAAADIDARSEAAVLPRLDQKAAIELATRYAQGQSIRLAEYKKINAKFEPSTGKWDISFAMDPMPPGGFFNIFVDDKTAEIVGFIKGE